MEKIKVNMSPNPLDVQTIHASQNDGEARQWEFELHNNGDVIDASEITDQMVFKAYKGGTEQILPENTSTPTTSPFLGDIRYPQGLLTDQEFLYRESPTEEDGLAKITDIKGNTLVWNQLVQNGNFENTSGWTVVRGTLSASSNVLSYTVDVLGGGGLQNRILCSVAIPAGHKVYISVSIKATKPFAFLANANGEFYLKNPITANEWNLCQAIRTVSTGMENLVFGCPSNIGDMAVGDVIQFKDVMLVDLTKMGLDYITDPSDFTSLFSLPYYAYNQGTLLSFNGNGIKTVGFNLCDNEWEKKSVNSSGTKVANNSTICNVSLINVSLHGSYYFHIDNVPFAPNGIYIHKFGANLEYLGYSGISNDSVVAIPDDTFYIYIQINRSGNITEDITQTRVNFNISDSSKNGTYEPYTSSTLSLPISTYFSTGMKSAGSVYDELTESKAITRIGALNIDSSTTIGTWESSDGWTANLILNTYKPNGAIKSDKFEYIGSFNGASSFATSAKAKGGYCLGIWENSNRVYFYSSSATTVNDLINAIRGTNLYYELATPIEASFSTASLVTENAEIPLSNEDGVLIGKCTEQLSENPGFIDAKIKLADTDGECYSNKIQLHVERSPQ